MMNVLMIGTDRSLFKPKSPAAERMILYGSLVSELHIIVLSLRADKLLPIQLAQNVYVYPTNSWSKFFYLHNAVSLGKKLKFKNPISGNPWPMVELGKTLPSGEKNFTVITSQDSFECGLIALQLAKFYEAGLELQVHTDLFSPYFGFSSLNKTRQKIAQKILPKGNHLRVVSDRLKNSILQRVFNNNPIFAPPISVTPIWREAAKLQNVSESAENYLPKKYPKLKFIILMMSRLEKEKNIELAIGALRKLLLRYPSAGLVIVGSGGEEGRLRALAKDLPENVIFEPWTEEPEKYYQSAQVFLNTSYYEGFGLSLLEAATAGCPIVTTDVGLVGSVLTEASVLVCSRPEIECIYQSLYRLLTDQTMRRELSKRAKEAVAEMGSQADFLAKIERGWQIASQGAGAK